MKRYIRSSTQSNYVIVDDKSGELFIAPVKQRGYYGDYYTPSYTSARRNNYSRAKIYKSEQEAQAALDKYNDQEVFKFSPAHIDTYDNAMANIGDTEANLQAYKDNQEAKRKRYQEFYKTQRKSQDEKNKQKDPGTYKVVFFYSNSGLGSETFTVKAESIDDAFKKAKAKALEQDPYRNDSGYDQKMTFNKNYIKKVS